MHRGRHSGVARSPREWPRRQFGDFDGLTLCFILQIFYWSSRKTEPCEDSDCVEVLVGDESPAGGHHRGGAVRAQEGARAEAEGEASQDGERGE